MKKIQRHNMYAYRRLRRAIGYLGMLLPIILVLLSLFHFFDTDIQPSISHYYFTNLREVFTGTLCAVAFFLICYQGNGNRVFWKNDNLLTNIAGVMALGVALVPTNPLAGQELAYSLFSINLKVLHYVFAAILFLSFSLLAIHVFTLGQAVNGEIPVSMLNENKIYRACGYAILLFIVLIPISSFPYATLIFETLSLLTFGIAWLVKGRALGDQGKIGEKLYREKNSCNTEDQLPE
ncbi:hypothetical protein PQ465_14105 [Sphingobacterium oryzagri]|uniref:DUF998 domain-containing protein n=1 Tax=Sphingobacterium oryzagri TaxID=3025669 RepID=A0ABY7WGM8_9SPHI|nr:hypothetical protein [Sphingobacterium sp. KACC 22765]WDF67435.1 hypothetical protein PQ465_14105 [Sphingobacterium sp. KACC 22765]